MTYKERNLSIQILKTFQYFIGPSFRNHAHVGEENDRAISKQQEFTFLKKLEDKLNDVRRGEKVFDDAGNIIDRSESDSQCCNWTASGLANAHEQENHIRNLQRAINLRKISLQSESEAEHLNPNPDNLETIDADWLERWREYAEGVSHPDMQQVWGRALAYEVQNPGSYSVHALDFLAKMSKRDIVLITQLASFQTKGGIFSNAGDILEDAGISTKDLIYLNDINILNGVVSTSGLVWNVEVEATPDGRYAVVPCNNMALVLYTKSKKRNHLTLPVYTLSQVGHEILSLASSMPDISYIYAIAKYAKSYGFHKAQIGTQSGDRIIDLQDINL